MDPCLEFVPIRAAQKVRNDLDAYPSQSTVLFLSPRPFHQPGNPPARVRGDAFTGLKTINLTCQYPRLLRTLSVGSVRNLPTQSGAVYTVEAELAAHVLSANAWSGLQIRLLNMDLIHPCQALCQSAMAVTSFASFAISSSLLHLRNYSGLNPLVLAIIAARLRPPLYFVIHAASACVIHVQPRRQMSSGKSEKRSQREIRYYQDKTDASR